MAAVEPPLVARVVQIRFHWTDRVEGIMSVDFHPTLPKLLTAGCDGAVKVWKFDAAEAHRALPDHTNDLQGVLTFASVLTSDQQPTPNIARWSPLGHLILAAYVTGEIVLWKPSEYTAGYFDKNDERSLNTEHWGIHRTLKLPNEATDAAFSSCSRYVISGCLTGSVFVHSADTGSVLQQLTSDDAHDHPARHVAFDPLMQLASSFGDDRMLRFYEVVNRRHGATLRPLRAVTKSSAKASETGSTFNYFKGGEAAFRRGSWSPDGAMFACPNGWARGEDADFRNCAYLFSRGDLGRPIAALAPRGRKTVAGVRFAPFVLESYGGDAGAVKADASTDTAGVADILSDELTARQALASWGPRHYRYALAVWTREDVSVYTSGSSARVCRLFDLHYDVINDVAFSPDARFIAVCSHDGYITLTRLREPLGRIAKISAFSETDILCRAFSAVTAPLAAHAEEFETRVTQPVSADAAKPANAAPLVVKKKKKDKEKRDRPAAADGAATEAAAAAEKPDAPQQPPAEPAAAPAAEAPQEMTAEALALALGDD